MEWRFAEDDDEGRAWLSAPYALQVYVDYRRSSSEPWRRLLVVTRAWLEGRLTDVRATGSKPLWIALPPVLVIPDAEPAALRGLLHEVLDLGLFDDYSAPVEEGG